MALQLRQAANGAVMHTVTGNQLRPVLVDYGGVTHGGHPLELARAVDFCGGSKLL